MNHCIGLLNIALKIPRVTIFITIIPTVKDAITILGISLIFLPKISVIDVAIKNPEVRTMLRVVSEISFPQLMSSGLCVTIDNNPVTPNMKKKNVKFIIKR